MQFLHDGRPPVVREATLSAAAAAAAADAAASTRRLHATTCCAILGSLNVASKEWIIRQYDHEVQGGSVIKPLVGVANDGPSDAAVVRPGARRRRAGLVDRLRHEPALRRPRPVPHGRLRHRRGGPQLRRRRRRSARGSPSSTTSAGATPTGPRRSARSSAPRSPATTWPLALGTPFISGKDSLNNEFTLRRRRRQAADDRDSALAADQRPRPDRRRRAAA